MSKSSKTLANIATATEATGAPVVATEPKRVPVVACTLVSNAEGRVGGLRLKFDNGQELGLASSQLTIAIMEMAVWHGLKQKLVDAAAISRNEETGRSATTADKFVAVKEVYDRLLAGQWNKTREGGSIGGLLFKALCSVYADKTPDAIKAFLDKKTDVEKAALRKMPKIAAAIEAIRAANAKTEGVDVDALLSELDD